MEMFRTPAGRTGEGVVVCSKSKLSENFYSFCKVENLVIGRFRNSKFQYFFTFAKQNFIKESYVYGYLSGITYTYYTYCI